MVENLVALPHCCTKPTTLKSCQAFFILLHLQLQYLIRSCDELCVTMDNATKVLTVRSCWHPRRVIAYSTHTLQYNSTVDYEPVHTLEPLCSLLRVLYFTVSYFERAKLKLRTVEWKDRGAHAEPQFCDSMHQLSSAQVHHVRLPLSTPHFGWKDGFIWVNQRFFG